MYFKNSNELENLSKVLADLSTGSKITNMLQNLQMNDSPYNNKSTKWLRLHSAFVNSYNNNEEYKIIKSIEWIFNPQNYITNRELWNKSITEINSVLQFNGLEVNQSGKVINVIIPKDYSEAYIRHSSLIRNLEPFKIHPRILSICRQDILRKDYYSLIFESSKLVVKKIQEISGSNLDGTQLINNIFDGKNPKLVLNTLSNNQEKNIYFGLKAMLHTIIYLYRNPKAHELKAYDQSSEIDAIEALLLMSKALILLDQCSKNTSV